MRSNAKVRATAQKLIVHFTATKVSLRERLAQGKRLRHHIPRSSHATLDISSRRFDPVDILEAQAATRLAKLIPVRYAHMLGSPFAFLRGSAAIMARDLSSTPRTDLHVQACGDMHVSNFGVFATAERALAFGINDFDETSPGTWEWDLKRLATSALVAGRFLGADKLLCLEAVRAVVQSYREHLQTYARLGHLHLWNTQITEQALLKALPKNLYKRAQSILAKTRRRTHLQVLAKLTEILDDQKRIVESKPWVVRETRTSTGRPVREALSLFLLHYMDSLSPDRRLLLSRYRVVDVARKFVGIGSMGTRCWIIYLEGQDDNDPLFLQIKEAQPSVLGPYFGKSLFANQGQRVVAGQRLIQGSPDIFLGWGEQDGTQYYVRQLRDMKGGVHLEPEKFRPHNLPDYAGLCGWALALAHAKSGDAALLAGYVGQNDALDEAIAAFAASYGDQTERDHAALKSAAKRGRIKIASPAAAGLH